MDPALRQDGDGVMNGTWQEQQKLEPATRIGPTVHALGRDRTTLIEWGSSMTT